VRLENERRFDPQGMRARLLARRSRLFSTVLDSRLMSA